MRGKQIRALIAEDEAFARDTLASYVDSDARLELIGAAASGNEALSQINSLLPDLIFLDVQMPELSGIDVLARASHNPAIIFTTADSGYAPKAFELGAIDYLLKPFGRGRFTGAVDRSIDRLRGSAVATLAGPLQRLFVRHKGAILSIRLADVSRLEAQDDYVLLHAPGGPYWVSTALSELETKLDPSQFRRIHRAHIINLEMVSRIDAEDARRLTVVMCDGATIIASRRSSQALRAAVA